MVGNGRKECAIAAASLESVSGGVFSLGAPLPSPRATSLEDRLGWSGIRNTPNPADLYFEPTLRRMEADAWAQEFDRANHAAVAEREYMTSYFAGRRTDDNGEPLREPSYDVMSTAPRVAANGYLEALQAHDSALAAAEERARATMPELFPPTSFPTSPPLTSLPDDAIRPRESFPINAGTSDESVIEESYDEGSTPSAETWGEYL